MPAWLLNVYVVETNDSAALAFPTHGGGIPGRHARPRKPTAYAKMRSRFLQKRLSAGDSNGGAGHVARKRIGQHDIGGRQLNGLTRSFHRDLLRPPQTGWTGMSGVQIGPGATALARMPFSSSICSSPAEKWIAPLVVA